MVFVYWLSTIMYVSFCMDVTGEWTVKSVSKYFVWTDMIMENNIYLKTINPPKEFIKCNMYQIK